MSEHTPVPWEGFPPQDPTMIKTVFGYPGMDDSERSPITSLGSGVKRKANAEFIIQACNSHEDLLEACKAFVDYYTQAGIGCCEEGHDDDPGDDGFDGEERFNVRAGRVAIAKAEGRKS